MSASPTPPLIPLSKRVLVAIEDEPVSRTLWVPRNPEGTPHIGRVAMIGRDVRGILPGDRVIFPDLQGAYLRIDGERFALVREETLLGVLEEVEGV